MGSWLATKYGQDDSTTASCKVDFMDINVNDDQDQEQEGGGGEEGAAPPIEIEKEHMFDKVVTPSDVGKLNRLVIPKQHAEKYFPLDSTVNEKGLLLNFEDRTAKLWRFRYSYWNSSQSYVMTKGWSRFVKDKKLDAGDIVSFQRGIGESGKDKLYIDWRRRPDTADHHHHHHRHQYQQQHQHHYLSSIPWSPLLMRPPPVAMGMMQREHLIYNNNKNNIGAGSGNESGSSYSSNYINGYNCSNSSTGTIVYMRSTAAAPPMVQWQQGGGGGGGSNRSTSGFNMVVEEPINMVYESVPVVQGKAAAKRLRLFGVNMDCPITSSSTTDHDSSSSEDQHQQVQLNLFTGTPIHHKHNNPSTSMSFDLGI